MIWLKDLLFLLVIPGMMVAGFPYLVLLTRSEPPRLPTLAAMGWGVSGLLLIAGGLLALLVCVADFARKGRGTPFPLDPPTTLVMTGLYWWVRNPMYVAVLNVVLGEAAVFRSGELIGYWFSVLLGFHLFVVLFEEPTLRRTFGPAYEAYCAAVPRWVPNRLRLPLPEVAPS